MHQKTVTIFGVFDGIHDGHRAFIHEARQAGERLVAVVARDSEVRRLKGKVPIHDEATRIALLLEVPEVDTTYLGDLEQGTYNILKEIKPDLIYLGYDQEGLAENLRQAIKDKILPDIEIKTGTPHKPEEFKSSIINNTTL